MNASTNAIRSERVIWRSWSDLERGDAVRELARFVRDGGVVVFPTESSYALGADPANAAGVAAVFRIKGRPDGKPLPVVAAGMEILEQLGVRPGSGTCSGLQTVWPGPLTLVLPCRGVLPAAQGRRELAVRIPGHRRLLDLLARAGVALTATSANLAGEKPLLELDRLGALVGNERVLAVDEGRLEGGLPSTLVRLEGRSATVLRTGAIDVERLREAAPDLSFEEVFSAATVEKPVEEDS